MLYYEDITVGDILTSAPYRTTRDSAIAFAREFDPQPFHLDDAGLTGADFEGLILSGWHIAAIVMRLMVDRLLSRAAGGLGLGADNLRWLHPVRPGDILTCEFRMKDKRISRSQQGYGIMIVEVTASNQEDKVVMCMQTAGLIRCREA